MTMKQLFTKNEYQTLFNEFFWVLKSKFNISEEILNTVIKKPIVVDNNLKNEDYLNNLLYKIKNEFNITEQKIMTILYERFKDDYNNCKNSIFTKISANKYHNLYMYCKENINCCVYTQSYTQMKG